jgi:hypothetical protein
MPIAALDIIVASSSSSSAAPEKKKNRFHFRGRNFQGIGEIRVDRFFVKVAFFC